MKAKIKTASELKERVKVLKRKGARIVFTNGCFDILHIGHVRYLEAAASYGDVLVVGVNSDSSVRELKGEGRPFVPEAERAEILAAFEMVDLVTVFAEDTPRKLIASILPDVLVKGGDWKPSQIAGAEEVELSGGEVITVDLVPGRSTTSLIEKIVQIRRREVEI